MDLSLNIDNIIESEISNANLDEIIDCSETSSLRNSIGDVVRSHFNTQVIFNEIGVKLHKHIEDAIQKKRIETTENCMLIRSDDIKNLPDLISFFKENSNLNLVQLDNRWSIVPNVSIKQLYYAQSFNKSPILFITLNRDNLSKYRNLLAEKTFTYSKDKKFLDSGCNFKLSVRIADNVSSFEMRERKEHYRRVINRLADTLTENGYSPKIGSSGEVAGFGLTLFCDTLPSLNILKLYRINNVKIGVPENRRIITNKEFEEIFDYFL